MDKCTNRNNILSFNIHMNQHNIHKNQKTNISHKNVQYSQYTLKKNQYSLTFAFAQACTRTGNYSGTNSAT